MLIPAPRLIALSAALLAAALAAALLPSIALLLAACALALVVAAAMDAVRIARAPDPRLRRTVSPVLPLGLTREVALDIANTSARPLVAAVYDFVPAATEVNGLPRTVQVPAGRQITVKYSLRPVERGLHRFDRAELRIRSPYALWEQRRRVGSGGEVRVFPNFGEVAKYALFATDHRLSQLGVLQRRRRGEGLDFHQLRDYRAGDSLRQIDWKASNRLRKLVSREYQDERNQNVLFLIDCGRRMSTRDGPLSHFDHALNAILLLAYVGLRQGDAVGMMTMGGDALKPPRYLAPGKSAAWLSRLLNTLFDLQPSLAAPDFLTAASALLGRMRKRALVVIVTNMRDEDTADLAVALRLLRRHHLVVLASLRERAVRDMLLKPVRQLSDAIGHAAAADYLMTRREAFARLAGTGALCLDVEPDELPLRLVNQYLEIKRAGLL